MRGEIVLIGPIRAGKSTQGRLLAEKLGVPQVSMDAVCWDYYKELGSEPGAPSINGSDGMISSRYTVYALERLLAEHSNCVFDLGAGHSVFRDEESLARARKALALCPNVVLLLPCPDLDKAARLLEERNTENEWLHTFRAQSGYDPNEHFLRHRSNHEIAKIIVYTDGKAPEETRDEILQLLKAIESMPMQAPVPDAAPRCEWASTPLLARYHDEEWGVPIHDDRSLFELLILEGAQAGLSWQTILRKRERYRALFDDFDARAIVAYGPAKVEQLLADPGIVRNRLKIAASIRNAAAFLAIQQEYGSFDAFIWPFIGGRPRQNAWRSLAELPARTPESDAMSKSLQKRGFKFVGSTICYAFMQATGMVNDHVVACFRHGEIGG